MAPDPHVDNAYRAMKAIGVGKATVKPVLKRLLTLYDWNWELIEAENYRVLADAIFEEDPEALEGTSNANVEEKDTYKSFFDSQPRKHGIHQASSSSVSHVAPSANIGVPAFSNGRDPSKGKQPIVDAPPTARNTHSVQNWDKDVCSTGILAGRKRPGHVLELETSAKRSHQVTPISEQSSDMINIAKSSSGEVKIFVSYKLSHGGLKNDVLSKDRILEAMEEKFQHLNRNVDSNFTLTRLLRKICDSVEDKFRKPQNNCTPGNRLVDGRSGVNKLVSPQNQSALQEFKPILNLEDITKGEENYEIPATSDAKVIPVAFKYIPQNVVSQTASVKFTLAQKNGDTVCPDCVEDCLSSPSTCTCSSDGFAYTSEGLLKQKFLDDCISTTRNRKKQSFSFCTDCPLNRVMDNNALEECKGHLVRRFIKECSTKCGCHKQCNNRVVQRGIKFKLQVFYCLGQKRWGLRTLERLQKGSFLCEYAGEILTYKERCNRVCKYKTSSRSLDYPVLLDAFWNMKNRVKDEEALCLDTSQYANVAGYIFHSCRDANLIEIPVKIEGSDDHYYHLALFTTRVVNPLEELTWDYGVGICFRQP